MLGRTRRSAAACAGRLGAQMRNGSRWVTGVGIACIAVGTAMGQRHQPGYNYDEAKIPAYTVLDPLVMADGRAVTTAKMWWGQRRPEIVRLFEEDEFGRSPASAQKVPLRAKVVETDAHALGGNAIREQVDVYFTDKLADGPKMRMLLYLPAHAKGRSPVVLGLNFTGNGTVVNDPGVLLTPVWKKGEGTQGPTLTMPENTTRGTQAAKWQVETVIGRGYGLATIYYGDIEADFKDASATSVRRLFLPAGQATFEPNAWGAFGAWAWGLSRAVDYLETDKLVDGRRIAVTGHSRLGKAADWAVAQDPRIAVLLSTESGHGGQTIQRRALGETVGHLEDSFGYWFCGNYARWVGKDRDIPVDGNLLLSLVAPRPVYVASAVGDEWSDPKGEFLSAVSASRVYRLLGKTALPTDATMPGVDQPIGVAGSAVAYHERSGVHDVTAFDWEQYLRFLDAQFGR